MDGRIAKEDVVGRKEHTMAAFSAVGVDDEGPGTACSNAGGEGSRSNCSGGTDDLS